MSTFKDRIEDNRKAHSTVKREWAAIKTNLQKKIQSFN